MSKQIALDNLLAAAEDAANCLQALDNGKWDEYEGTLLLAEDDWGAIREQLVLLKRALDAFEERTSQ